MEAFHRGHRINKTNGIVDIHVNMPHGSYEPRIVSIYEDGDNGYEAIYVESMASTWISELAQFKKDNINIATNKASNSLECNWMNDFVEMERLTSLVTEKADGSSQHFGEVEKLGGTMLLLIEEDNNTFSLTERNGTLEETPRIHETYANAIFVAEKLSVIQSERYTNEAENASLLEVLCMVFKAHEKSQNMDEFMGRVKDAFVKA